MSGPREAQDRRGKLTVEVRTGEGLDNGQAKEEISRWHPTFDDDVPVSPPSMLALKAAVEPLWPGTTHSRSKGITTGPPPKMMVPARYILANNPSPLGAGSSTPRNIMIGMKVRKKPAAIQIPNFQLNIRWLNVLDMVRESCSAPSASGDTLGSSTPSWDRRSSGAGAAERRECVDVGLLRPLVWDISWSSSLPGGHAASSSGRRLWKKLMILSRQSQRMVAMPPANISTGKYHSALYNIPAVPPMKTKMRVNVSLMAFCESWIAARAMIPTVAALRPVIRAYTGAGRVSSTRWMPTASPYIPSAPGRLQGL